MIIPSTPGGHPGSSARTLLAPAAGPDAPGASPEGEMMRAPTPEGLTFPAVLLALASLGGPNEALGATDGRAGEGGFEVGVGEGAASVEKNGQGTSVADVDEDFPDVDGDSRDVEGDFPDIDGDSPGGDALTMGLEHRLGAATPPQTAPVDTVTLDRARLRNLRDDFVARLQRVADRMWNEHGVRMEVVEGYRTDERQQRLFAQGRTTEGPVVTWTRNSLHTAGAAADVRIDGAPVTAEQAALLARAARQEGLRTLYPFDSGHIQLDGAAPTAGPEGPLPREGSPTPNVGRTSSPGVAPVAPVARPARPARPGGPAGVGVTSAEGVFDPGAASLLPQDGGVPLPRSAAIPLFRDGDGPLPGSGRGTSELPATSMQRGSEATVRSSDPRGRGRSAGVILRAGDPPGIAGAAGRPAGPGQPTAPSASGRAAESSEARVGGRAAEATAAAVSSSATAAPATSSGAVAASSGISTPESAQAAVSPPSFGDASAAPGSPELASTSRLSHVDLVSRIARIEALAEPTSQRVHVPIEGLDGSASLRVGVRGGSVDASLTLSDPVLAVHLRSKLHELRRTLTIRGIDPGGLSVRLASDAAPLSAATSAAGSGDPPSQQRASADTDQRQPERHHDPAEERRRNDRGRPDSQEETYAG